MNQGGSSGGTMVASSSGGEMGSESMISSSTPSPADSIHPRSILAFCKYFGEVVVGGAFEIDLVTDPEIAETLTELATSLVFYRIEPIITNYLRQVSYLFFSQ